MQNLRTLTEGVARSMSGEVNESRSGEVNASRSGEVNGSRSDLLDSEDDIIVMSQYDGKSDCDSSVDQDTQSERSSPKGAPIDTLTDGGFEPHGYLARLTDTPSPPNYSDPWGLRQVKAKDKKRSSKKKRRK